MRKIEFKVEGMHCSGCSARIEKILKGLCGILSVIVILEEKNVYVEFDESKITTNQIKEAIEDAGFEVK